MSEIILTEQAAGVTPGTGKRTLYMKADGKAYIKDSAGAEVAILRTGDVAKGDVGLGSVDNTSDVDKPVSTAQAEAIAATELPIIQLAYGLAAAFDLAAMANKRVTDATSYLVQSGEATITQAASTAMVRTYATVAVTLPKPYQDADYQVAVECISAVPALGFQGNVQVQSRATNGFVLAITGSATSAVLRWKTFHPNAK